MTGRACKQPQVCQPCQQRSSNAGARCARAGAQISVSISTHWCATMSASARERTFELAVHARVRERGRRQRE
eukprot:1620920-Pleurochrysis_carterae.AAC.2